MDRQLIEKYAAGAEVPAKEIAGLTKDQLNAQPVPGTWSIQQIVLHLMDSDLIGSDRMKRVIAEENPTLIGYNESAFAEKLIYDQLDAATACDIFAKNRRLTAQILRSLPDAAFQRAGTHNEHGRVTLADLLETYVNHVEHHVGFIRQKRERVAAKR